MGQVVETVLKVSVDSSQVRSLQNEVSRLGVAADKASQAFVGGPGRYPLGTILDAHGRPMLPSGGGGVGAMPGGGGASPPPPPRTPGFRDRIKSFMFGGEGFQTGRLEQFGYSAIMLNQALDMLAGSASSYMGSFGPETGALFSGSLGSATQGVLSAQLARKQALIQGGVGGVGTMAGSGLIAMSSTMGSPWARAGMVFAGIVTSAAAQWGAAFWGSVESKATAKESAGASMAEQVFRSREQLAELSLSAMRLGGRGLTDADHRFGVRFGLSPNETGQRWSQFISAGGVGISLDALLGAESRYGIGGGSLAGMIRNLRPGMGAAYPGDYAGAPNAAREQARETMIAETIGTALAAGLDKARIPEFLGMVASQMSGFASYGMTVSARDLERTRLGLVDAGYMGFQANTVANRVDSLGISTMMSMSGMRFPKQAIDARIRAGLISKFGSEYEARRGLESMLQRGEFEGFLQDIAMGIGEPGARSAFLQNTLGMSPSASEKFLKYGKGKLGRAPLRGPGAIAETPEFEVGQFQAIMDATTALSKTIPQLSDLFQKMTEVLGAALGNMEFVGNAPFDKAISELRNQSVGDTKNMLHVVERVDPSGKSSYRLRWNDEYETD